MDKKHAAIVGVLDPCGPRCAGDDACEHGQSRLVAKVEWYCYEAGDAITAAALLRVTVPELAPPLTAHAWLCAGIAWTLAFLGYAVRFGPMLLSPRVDGKAG